MERLQERVDEFAATGITQFARWELLRWFSQKRVSKTVWQTLDGHLKGANSSAKPQVIEKGEDFVVFDSAKSAPLKTSGE